MQTDSPVPSSSESGAAQAPAKPKARAKPSARKAGPPLREPHPLLHQLAAWHPALFGARFLPLKVGIFEDLLALHPELDKAELKAALAFHARSTRYLEAVAVAGQRHGLDGEPVDTLAPEHRFHAMVEVFRRRQHRTPKDLKPWLVERLVRAIDASGLGRDGYAAHVRTGDPAAQQALQDALGQVGERAARHEAVRRAYEASGRGVEEFAQMYGLDRATVEQALAAGSAAPQPSPDPSASAAESPAAQA